MLYYKKINFFRCLKERLDNVVKYVLKVKLRCLCGTTTDLTCVKIN